MVNKALNSLKKLQKIHLSKDEKLLMRQNLVRFIKNEEVENPSLLYIIQSSLFRRFRPLTAVISLGIVLMTGAGVSYAAESSVPGEALYAFKLHVNERIRSALAVSTEGKSDWEVQKVERRLEEAHKLSESGELNAENKDVIKKELIKHRKDLKELTKDLKEKDAEKINEHLSSTFSKHRKDLEEVFDQEVL